MPVLRGIRTLMTAAATSRFDATEGGNDMRNRKKQQELIKAKVIREEKLELHDSCGIKDPTPYEAVKNMIRTGRTTADCRTAYAAARRA